MRNTKSQRARSQRGMALISAMLLLIVVTILAVSMFRSYGMQEKIAGNTREKQRAMNAAVSAQQYAEWWLSTGTAPASAPCTGLVAATVGQVCNNTLESMTPVSTVPWMNGAAQVGVTFTQFASTAINSQVMNVTGTTGTPSMGSYYAAPVFYIADLGPMQPASGLTGELYQIDAVGYGGTANSVAVVESTYLVSTKVPQGHDK